MPLDLGTWLHDPTRRRLLRTAQVAFVLLLVAAIAGGVLLARAALDAILGPPIVERRSEIRSPDASWVAVTYQVDRTGALGGFNYEIRLARPHRPTERGSLVWDSYMECPVRVRWLSNSAIEVEATDDSPGHIHGGRMIHERRSHGVAARTLIVQNGRLIPFHAGQPQPGQ
jgi:hypothetical protein